MLPHILWMMYVHSMELNSEILFLTPGNFVYSFIRITVFLLVSVFVNFPIFPISYTAFKTVHICLASCTLWVSNFIYMVTFHGIFGHFGVVQVYFRSPLFRTHVYHKDVFSRDARFVFWSCLWKGCPLNAQKTSTVPAFRNWSHNYLFS
jgi:hypothetical protein